MADFFDQFTAFCQWYGDMWYRGITSPAQFYAFVKGCNDNMKDLLNGLVHPYFMAIFSFAIGVALLHKLMHMNSKG